MSPQFHLSTDDVAQNVIDWCHTAAVGATAILTSPSHACTFFLLRCAHDRIRWWSPGRSGVTQPIEDVEWRLNLLCNSTVSDTSGMA